MLRAVHGNRAEGLLAALLAALPPADPFAPATIVTGGHLVGRWLAREIALARGIAAGLELVTFDRFVERTWAGDAAARAAGLVGLDRRQLVAAIASVLAEPAVVRGLPPVAAYLDGGPQGGDRAAPRRVQLADRLAELAWDYATTRPDWMPALLAGRVPAELDGDAGARWQAAVLAATFEHLARVAPGRRCAPIPLLPWARRRAGLEPPVAAPTTVFGVSYLARAQLEALTALAETSDVTAYLLDPCRELWDDVGGRGAAGAGDPLPLVMWGRPVRDTLAALVERTGGDVEDAFIDTGASLRDAARPAGAGPCAPPRTARDRLLADVLDRRAPAGDVSPGPAGATVLACPNPRREIEVVAAEIRRLLDDDPGLRANEIAVWLAGPAADRYLALATAAFEAVAVPCHLVDAPIDDRGRIAEAVGALLELPGSPMRRRELLRVLTHPAVLAGYPHVDAADWIRWTEALGIAHGADGAAHAGTYLEDEGQFHWDQGVRRLALGAFMAASRGAVPIADQAGAVRDVQPEDVRPEQQASAATFALLVRSLCGDAAWLAEHTAPLAGWAEIFAALVDTYLAARDDDAARDLERVRAMLAGLARLDLDGRAVGFREARAHALRQLASARADRGEPLAAGVMVAPLAAMRALPARVAFVLGLDEGAFPAGDRTSPLDLRRTPRPGDVAPRDRDRAAFLEVLLGARDALYLSYVAVEAKSGAVRAPSSIVLELADALAPYLGGASSSREALAQLTVRYPLHRHTAPEPGAAPAAAREHWASGVRDALRAHLRAGGHAIPDEAGLLALLAHPSQAALREQLALVDAPPAAAAAPARSISIANLRKFLEAPVQAWAQAVLGLDELPDEAEVERSDEPFALERPARAQLLRDALAAWLAAPDQPVAEHYDERVGTMRLSGAYPVGVFGEAARARDLEVLARWTEALAGAGPATRLGFGRANVATGARAELVPALELALPGGRAVRLVGQTELLVGPEPRRTSVIALPSSFAGTSHHHVRGALDHVVLAAAGLAPDGHEHLLLGPDGKQVRIAHAPWAAGEARAYLAGLCAELLDAPHGYLLPFDVLAKVLGGAPPPAADQLSDPTQGLGYGPIDRRDGLDVPPDAAAIARRRLGPLVARMTGPHKFEVAP